jgi:hypothetical protein
MCRDNLKQNNMIKQIKTLLILAAGLAAGLTSPTIFANAAGGAFFTGTGGTILYIALASGFTLPKHWLQWKCSARCATSLRNTQK